jgi:hypothetical protein
MTCIDQALFVTRAGVKTKFMRIPLDTNIVRTMFQLPGGLGHMAIPHARLRYADDEDEALGVFNLGMPLGLRPVSHGPIEREGVSLIQVRFKGPFGDATADIDPATKLIHRQQATFVPRGGDKSAATVFTLRMSPVVRERLEAPIAFDPAGRTGVDDLSDLRLARGDSVGDLTLSTMDGRSVKVFASGDSVVVMTFWATWLGQAESTLEQMDDVANWARTAGLPVKVLAVNAAEGLRRPADDTSERRLDQVKAFWAAHAFALTPLMDLRDEVHSMFGFDNPLATVVIGPGGVIAGTYQAFDPNFADTLKKDLQELLAEKK